MSDGRLTVRVAPWMLAFGIGFGSGVFLPDAGTVTLLVGAPFVFVATWAIVERVEDRIEQQAVDDASDAADAAGSVVTDGGDA